MSNLIERISLRAQDVIVQLSKLDKISYQNVISVIEKEQGLGADLIKTYIQVKTNSRFKDDISLNRLTQEAFFQALTLEHIYIGTEHILLALLSISKSSFYPRIKIELERMNSLQSVFRNMDVSRRTPTLSNYAVDITRSNPQSQQDLVQRKEIEQVYATLLQRNNANLIIVGDSGVGKDKLVALFARNVSMFESPQEFLGARVLELDFPAFISGLGNNETIDSAVRNLANELLTFGTRTFVSIKNFQSIFSSPGLSIGSSLAFRNMVERFNQVGARVIIALQTELFDKLSVDQEQLLRGFSVMWLKEPSKEVTLQILRKEAKRLSEFYLVNISPDVCEYAYNKAKDMMKDDCFPKKAVDLLDRVCASAVARNSKMPKGFKGRVKKHIQVSTELETQLLNRDYDKATNLRADLEAIEKSFSTQEKTLPKNEYVVTKRDVDKELTEILDLESRTPSVKKESVDNLLTLGNRIKQKIIGQDEAVDVVVKALIRSQMGLRAKKRPVGCFLFLGPTGVGKTELAKVLSTEYFGNDSILRLDMSDFSEKHTVSRLVGAPPGYIGYNEGGELTSKIDENPKRVVLFDEIEKAHADVLNILLQIMEEGELRDMRGDTFNFSECIIILTSNLGTESVHKRDIGYGGGQEKVKSDIENRIRKVVKGYIKPELLNRFDEVVVFNALSSENAEVILAGMLDDVRIQLKQKRKSIEIDRKVHKHLIDKGFSAEFGARSLRRTVETELLDVIADHLLKNASRKVGKMKASVKADSIIVRE